jgi:voltage-gated potassium channel
VITTASLQQMPRSTRRRLLLRALLRPTLSAGVLFILYFRLPLDRSFTDVTVVVMAVGLLLFVAVIAAQARAIQRSRYPRLTAIEALAFSIPLFVLLFATGYYLMERSVPLAFSEHMTRLDALYYTVTVLSTVGFGDIVARTQLARAITTVQMVGDLVLFGLAARVLLNAVQTGLARRDAPDSGKRSEQAPSGTDS